MNTQTTHSVKTFVESRRQKLSQKLNSILNENSAVLFFSGEPITKPGGLDQCYPFIPFPNYYWISGSRRSLGITLYSKKTGWVDFINPITVIEKLWEGPSQDIIPNYFIALENFKEKMTSFHFSQTFLMGTPQINLQDFLKYNSQSESLIEETYQMQIIIEQCRRHKDSFEIELVKQCAHIAAKGYEKFVSCLRPGLSEKEMQAIYESEIMKQGSDKTPYDTIIGAGENSAVLHAIPTTKLIEKDELVLIDAGVDLQDYCVDITRVYSSTQKMTTQQQALYDVVLSAHTQAIQKCRIDTEWKDIHILTAQVIAEGLKSFGLLKSSVDDCLSSGAISMFYPHGVGHLVGLRVRDTGCIENKNPKKYCGANLRVDLKLQENYMLTVEPGFYFVRNMIESDIYQKQFSDFFNWSELEKWKSIGGVRLEDDIVITSGEAMNLTSIIPK